MELFLGCANRHSPGQAIVLLPVPGYEHGGEALSNRGVDRVGSAKLVGGRQFQRLLGEDGIQRDELDGRKLSQLSRKPLSERRVAMDSGDHAGYLGKQ